MELILTQELKIPDRETVDRSVARWQEVCQMLDAFNLFLDEAFAQRVRSTYRSSKSRKSPQSSTSSPTRKS